MKLNKFKNILFFFIPFYIFMLILLVLYPGIITYDGNNQWQQIETGLINNAHPFFSTYFMLILSKIWKSPTIILIYQVFLFSFFWYVFCKNIANDERYYKRKIIFSFIISLCPIISLYSITLWKDILYSYYLMLIIYYIYKGIINNFKFNYCDILCISLMLFLIFNYRYNGIITSLLLLLFFIAILFIKKEKISKIFILILSFICLNIIIIFPKNYYLNKTNNNTIQNENKYSISTLDGYMAWMMGAHLNRNYIDENDKKFLNKIVPLSKWKKAYTPYLINESHFVRDDYGDVKYMSKNIKKFRKIFKKYSIKHPETIIYHYVKADALLWCPIPIGYVYSFDFTNWWPNYEFNNGEKYGFNNPLVKLPLLKKMIEKVTQFTLKFPFKLIYQPANALYCSILLIILIVKKKKNKLYYLILLPAIFNTLPLLLINLAQDLRYVYINYLTLLFILLLFVTNFNFCDIKIYIKSKIKHN